MSRSPLSFGKIDVGLSTTLAETHGKPVPETPFRVLILGDFTGRASRDANEPGQFAGRKPILIDRDNFDEVLDRLGVEIRIALAPDAPPLVLRFRELDDFHPDRLVKQVELFDYLRDTRERLNRTSTFEQAAEEVRRWAQLPTQPADRPAPAAPPASGEDLLDQLLGESTAQPSEPASSPEAANWNAYLARLVQPHLAPRTDPQQAELVAAVDQATSEPMRAILHHPAFQAIEAAWRSLFFLVRRLDTGTDLRLYLLDVSKAELAADLGSADDLTRSAIYKVLVEQTVGTPGAQPWAVVVGDYTFKPQPADVEVLGRMSKLAAQAGAPFLAATTQPGQPTADQEAWDLLRHQPEAAYVGLAWPRILLRPPYGKETSPLEQFEFEELAGKPDHEAFLWGNPAFACAYLLAQAFSRAGWDLRPGMVQEIEGLPLYVDREADEVLPCAEVLLIDREAAAVLNAGVMPVRSVRNQDAVLLTQFQSIAEPPAPLAGRWA